MGQLSPISDKLFTTIFGVASALGALAGEEEFPPARPGEGKGEPARRSSDHVRSHVRLKSATAPSAAGNDLAAAASSTGLILRKALLRCEEILAMASEALSTQRGDNNGRNCLTVTLPLRPAQCQGPASWDVARRGHTWCYMVNCVKENPPSKRWVLMT